MIRPLLICLLLFMAIGVIGCSPFRADRYPAPTDTPLPPENTPTPTIVWFPEIPTPALLPTTTSISGPTPVIKEPGHGPLIFQDDFSDPTAWNLVQTGSNSIALGIRELTLAINRPMGYLFSLRREPALEDFYMEITASPTICRGPDEYGLLFRAASNLDFYRFSITCDGRTRLDRVLAGKATSPQPLIPSGEVPLGAPSESRLAVWVKGKEMDFYINGEFQFAIRDQSIPSGKIGVFARSAGDNSVTVNFSDLKVFSVEP